MVDLFRNTSITSLDNPIIPILVDESMLCIFDEK